ncbi:putative replication protein [Escherichia coli PA48]|nr:putative replication protein [Escherichia coli PA48]EYY50768.1 hypothetical protein BX83_08285 [Escherichia coli O157:H7 str. 2010C-4979C1]
MNIIKQQGGMFGPNKNISEWCIPQNRGTQKTLLQKKKEKIIRQRILANPLTSQKTTFLW